MLPDEDPEDTGRPAGAGLGAACLIAAIFALHAPVHRVPRRRISSWVRISPSSTYRFKADITHVCCALSGSSFMMKAMRLVSFSFFSSLHFITAASIFLWMYFT